MKTNYHKESEINQLVEDFRKKQLNSFDWTHETHLTVAIWFVKKYEYFEAICYLRSGIIEYNASTKTQNTPKSGYHETITLFWIWLVDAFIKTQPNSSLLELCNTFLNSKYADKNLLTFFYSKELLFSTKGRATWVKPDKQQLIFPF